MPRTTTRRATRQAESSTAAAILEVAAEPHELGPDELALIDAAGSGAASDADTTAGVAAEPTLLPPVVRDMHIAAPPEAAAAATITGQRITALWAEQANRNARVNLQTAGWKKLSTRTDSGSTTLTLLAAHARAAGVAPTLTEDPAGTISSMYVW